MMTSSVSRLSSLHYSLTLDIASAPSLGHILGHSNGGLVNGSANGVNGIPGRVLDISRSTFGCLVNTHIESP